MKFNELDAMEILKVLFTKMVQYNATDLYINTKRRHTEIQYRVDERIINDNNVLDNVIADRLRMILIQNSGGDINNVKEVKSKAYIKLPVININLKIQEELKSDTNTIDIINILLKKNFLHKKNKNTFFVDEEEEIKEDEETFEFRLSVVYKPKGFTIALRYIRNELKNFSLEELGFLKQHENIIHKIQNLPKGLILIVGATGSGKTTTISTFLNDIHQRTNKRILTIEDPIEITNENFEQFEINEEGEEEYRITYSNFKHTLLRQKPDCILIGESRDLDTIMTSISASLTGHLTFTTLHANNVKETIDRLLEIGVERYQIETSLRSIISQQMIPKLCDNCKIEDKENQKHIEGNKTIYKESKEGCEKCYKGFNGKEIIYELAILKDGSTDNYKIKNLENYINKEEVAYEKLLQGKITYNQYKKDLL